MKKTAGLTGKTFYILSVGVFFVALLAGNIAFRMVWLSRVSNVLACLCFVLMLLGGIFSLREKVYAYPWFYVGFFFVAALFWDLSYIKCTVQLNSHEQVNAWSGLVALNVSLVIWLANALRGRSGKRAARGVWRRYMPLWVICAAFVLLFLLNHRVWFLVDSKTYASDIAVRAGTWNFRFTDLQPLQPAGHLCQAYSIPLMIGEFLAPGFGVGQRVVSCLLSIAAIIAFYFVAEKIWGREKRLRCALLTVIFAFAPLFYGISHLISTDFPLLVYFTLLLAAAFYDIKFLKFISILAVCYSKENGVFVLAGFYLGEVIASFLKEHKKTVRGFFRELFRVKRMAMYSGAILYALILFFGNGGWATRLKAFLAPATGAAAQENIYVWWHYPVYKIFEYFFMNFYWLMWPLLLIALVTAVVHCRREGISFCRYLGERFAPRWDYYIPIVLAYAAFCVVGIAYLTYIHYRYIQLGHLFYVLCLGIIMDMFPKVTVKKELLLVPVAVLLTAESFVLFDPVTYLFFNKFDAGNGKLITTSEYWYLVSDESTGAGYYWEADAATMGMHYLADGTEYNREMIGLQKVLERALEKIGCSDDTLLVLDMFAGWPEYTCDQLFGVMDATGWYWDPDENTVVRYETDCPMCLAFDSDDLTPLMRQYAHVYYLDVPFNPYHENDVLQRFPAKDSFSESFMRWKIDVYRLK